MRVQHTRGSARALPGIVATLVVLAGCTQSQPSSNGTTTPGRATSSRGTTGRPVTPVPTTPVAATSAPASTTAPSPSTPASPVPKPRVERVPFPKPAPSPKATVVKVPPITPLDPKVSTRVTSPEGALSAFGSIWVTGHHSRTAFRVEPKTGTILATIPGIGFHAQWPFAGAGLVWVPSDDSLVAIDPGTNRIVRTFAGQVAGGVFAAGHPWVDDAHDSLVELDPKTGAPLVQLKSGSGFPEDCFNEVRFGDGSIWWSIEDAGLVVRIDPATGHVLATISGVGQDPSAAAFAAHGVWVAAVDGSVHEIDPGKNSVSTVTTYAAQLPNTCEDMAAGQGGTVWIGHGNASLLYGIDGRTRSVTHLYDLGSAADKGIPGFSQLQGIAVDGRSLWIPLYGGNRVQRYDPQ